MWTGKQSTHAPVWFTGVMGTARWKGSASNRARPVLVEGRAFSIGASMDWTGVGQGLNTDEAV